MKVDVAKSDQGEGLGRCVLWETLSGLDVGHRNSDIAAPLHAFKPDQA